MSDSIVLWEIDWTDRQEIVSSGQGIISEVRSRVHPAQRAILKEIVPAWKNDPQARQRLQQEPEILTKLHNLGAKVPALYDCSVKHAGVEPFLVMEFIHGLRFDAWLRTTAPVSTEKGVVITMGIAETIELCHKHTIGHRDLKPANIILKNGEINSPYVLDFGVSFDSRQSVTRISNPR